MHVLYVRMYVCMQTRRSGNACHCWSNEMECVVKLIGVDRWTDDVMLHDD